MQTQFLVFDARGASCGMITVPTADVKDFVALNWNGDIHWNGLMPDDQLSGAAQRKPSGRMAG